MEEGGMPLNWALHKMLQNHSVLARNRSTLLLSKLVQAAGTYFRYIQRIWSPDPGACLYVCEMIPHRDLWEVRVKNSSRGHQRGACVCVTSGPRLASRLRMLLSDICSRTATGGIRAMVAGSRVTSAFMSLRSSSSCLRTDRMIGGRIYLLSCTFYVNELIFALLQNN